MIVKQTFDVFSVMSVSLVTVGAFFLVRSIIQTGAKEIASMAGTYVGSNPHLQSALVQQKADTLIGFLLTFLGGVFGILAGFISAEVNLISGTVAVVLSCWVILFFSAFYIAKLLRKKLQLRADAISFTHHVESYLRHGQVDVDKLFKDALKNGLSDFLKGESCPFGGLAKVLRFAGASPGAEYILSLKSKGTKSADTIPGTT